AKAGRCFSIITSTPNGTKWWKSIIRGHGRNSLSDLSWSARAMEDRSWLKRPTGSEQLDGGRRNVLRVVVPFCVQRVMRTSIVGRSVAGGTEYLKIDVDPRELNRNRIVARWQRFALPVDQSPPRTAPCG